MRAEGQGLSWWGGRDCGGGDSGLQENDTWCWRETEGVLSALPRGVRPRLEGKPRTPLSSRVATRVSWSPLSVP